MSDLPLPVEAVEPDPSATSLPNDETVNKENGDSSAPTEAKDATEQASAKTDDAEGKKPLKTSSQGFEGSKYDPTVLPVTDDAQLIRNQVEFYFSDANLPTDNHMLKMTEGTLNLPVSVSNLMKFGRMKRFQPVSAVVEALRESKMLDVTGPEGAEEVKRKVAWDGKDPEDESLPRSVYVKGFGDEYPKSQFDIETFFALYGPTRQVRLRRTQTKDKTFKGSVFVEFEDEETAQKFLALDPKPVWKDHPLEIKSKKAYVDGKNEEIRSGELEPQRSFHNNRNGGRGGNRDGGRHRNNRDRGDRDRNYDKDDWNKRRDDDRANGFKNDRRGSKRGGRGGRGRGGDRGGRRDRDDRGPRNDRNQEREERNGAEKSGEVTAKVETNDKKRTREDGAGNDGPAAKKVDTKTEIAAGS